MFFSGIKPFAYGSLIKNHNQNIGKHLQHSNSFSSSLQETRWSVVVVKKWFHPTLLPPFSAQLRGEHNKNDRHPCLRQNQTKAVQKHHTFMFA